MSAVTSFNDVIKRGARAPLVCLPEARVRLEKVSKSNDQVDSQFILMTPIGSVRASIIDSFRFG